MSTVAPGASCSGCGFASATVLAIPVGSSLDVDPPFAEADYCPVAAGPAMHLFFLLPLAEDFFTRDRDVAALRYASPAITKKNPEKIQENAMSASNIPIRAGLLK